MTETQYNPRSTNDGRTVCIYQKKRGAGFWVAVGLSIFFFLCSVLLFTLFVGSLLLHKAVGTGATAAEETPINEIVVEGSGVDKVAIISIKGILSSESAEGLLMEKPSIVEVVKQHLEHARKDAHVKAILLEIDSPGGGITASDIIYNNVIKFKTDTKKRWSSICRTLQPPADIISPPPDAIVAHPTTITGSIGVIMPLINVAGLINRYGIVDNSITSGDMKGIGSPLKQMTPEETAILKSIIDEMYMQFVTVVSARKKHGRGSGKKIADGRIYTGETGVRERVDRSNWATWKTPLT